MMAASSGRQPRGINDYHRYTDSLVTNKYFNRFIVASNNLFAVLYRNLVNICMISPSSHHIKSQIARIELTRRRDEATQSMLRDVLNYSPNQMATPQYNVIGLDAISNSNSASIQEADKLNDGHNGSRKTMRANQRQVVRMGLKTTEAQAAEGDNVVSNSGCRQQVNDSNGADDDPMRNEAIVNVPRQNFVIIIVVLVLQIVLIVRLITVWLYYSDLYPKKPMISTRMLAGGIKKSAVRHEYKLSLAKILPTSGSPLVEQDNSKSNNRCLTKIETYFNENYNEFFIWNISSWSMEPSENLVFIIEQTVSIQQFRIEVISLYYLTLNFMLSCLLITSVLIYDNDAHDVAPLALIYEPKYFAAVMQIRTMKYLDLIRQSYMNYWTLNKPHRSIGDTDGNDYISEDEVSEVTGDDNDDCDDDSSDSSSSIASSTRQISSDPSLNSYNDNILQQQQQQQQQQTQTSDQHVVDSVCLSYRLFESYMPTVRTQAWRRLLALAQPIMHYSAFGALMTFNSYILVLFVLYNRDEENHQLRSFLLDEDQEQSDSISSVITRGQTSESCADFLSESAYYIKQSIIEELARALSKFDGNIPRLLNSNISNNSSRQALWNYVINSIGPHEKIPLYLWIGPALHIMLVGEVVVLYLMVCFMTNMDICIGLSELRLKMAICIKLLRYYQSSLVNASRRTDPLIRMISNTSNAVNSQPLAQQQKSSYSTKPAIAYIPTTVDNPIANNYLSRPPTRPMLLQLHHLKSHPVGVSRLQRHILDGPRQNKPVGSGSDGGSKPGSAKKTKDDIGDYLPICNIELRHTLIYMMANRHQRDRLIEAYAYQLIYEDIADSLSLLKASRKFLISTYLDFRLFLDQIKSSRKPMNAYILMSAFHSLNMIAVGIYIENSRIRIGVTIIALLLVNSTLVCLGLFYSKCCKLNRLIHSILVSCIDGDKTIKHLALLWRRSLSDLTGSKTKLAFGLSSMKLTYASLLQFNLSLASVYLVILDRTHHH